MDSNGNILWKIQGWGLVLITFIFFFPPLSRFNIYLFFIMLLGGVVVAKLNHLRIWIHSPIDKLLLLLLGWILLSLPFAIDQSYSFSEWLKLVAKVLMFYWVLLVLSVSNKKTIIHGIFKGVVAGAFILSGYALIYFFVSGGSPLNRAIRAIAPISDYNWLSTYLVISIPVVVSVALSTKKWRRFLYLSVGGLAIITLFFTYSRAGWLGLLAEGICAGLFTRRRWMTVLIITAGLAGSISLIFLSQMGYYTDIIDPYSLKTRLNIWWLGIQTIMSNPLFGVGYGNDTFIRLFPSELKQIGISHLHSTFLMVTAGSGIPAFIFLVGVLVKATSAIVKGARNLSDPDSYNYMMGIATMVVGFSVSNLFDYMFTGSLAYLFWILVATALSDIYSRTTSQDNVMTSDYPLDKGDLHADRH